MTAQEVGKDSKPLEEEASMLLTLLWLSPSRSHARLVSISEVICTPTNALQEPSLNPNYYVVREMGGPRVRARRAHFSSLWASSCLGCHWQVSRGKRSLNKDTGRLGRNWITTTWRTYGVKISVNLKEVNKEVDFAQYMLAQKISERGATTIIDPLNNIDPVKNI